MARRLDKNEAIRMRLLGASFSQIKNVLGVGKGTLSAWLRDHPLSEERLRELQDNNAARIERCRNTKARKREERLKNVYAKAATEIGELTKREIFVAGLFLYWGEGTKSAPSSVALTNTDPAMIKFYLSWLDLFGVVKDRLRIKLHLYSDMNIANEIDYWSNILNIPTKQFKKPYIKNSLLSQLTYKNGFGHGTCSVIYEKVPTAERMFMLLKHVREMYL